MAVEKRCELCSFYRPQEDPLEGKCIHSSSKKSNPNTLHLEQGHEEDHPLVGALHSCDNFNRKSDGSQI